MTKLQGQLPRIFQANISRLYQRVVLPGMMALPVHDKLEVGVASTMDEFLDRCASQVDNYTANEAHKIYVLVMIALFERQLRIWAGEVLIPKPNADVPTMKFQVLLPLLAEKEQIDLKTNGLGQDLVEAFLVANVVRHGDGASSKALRAAAAHLGSV